MSLFAIEQALDLFVCFVLQLPFAIIIIIIIKRKK
jgi:hypothetical protein